MGDLHHVIGRSKIAQEGASRPAGWHWVAPVQPVPWQLSVSVFSSELKREVICQNAPKVVFSRLQNHNLVVQITRVTQTQLPSKFGGGSLVTKLETAHSSWKVHELKICLHLRKGQGRSTCCKVSSSVWCLPSRWNRQKWGSCFCFRSTAAECALIWILSLES